MGTITYLVLNGSVLALVVVALWRYIQRDAKAWWVILLHLVPLTVIFDGLCIALGFFWYSRATTTGITIGPMPVEDLFYILVAVIVAPALWKVFGSKKEGSNA